MGWNPLEKFFAKKKAPENEGFEDDEKIMDSDEDEVEDMDAEAGDDEEFDDEEDEVEDDDDEYEEKIKYGRKDKKAIADALKARKRNIKLPYGVDSDAIDKLVTDLAEAQKGLKLGNDARLNETFVKQVSEIQNKILSELGHFPPGDAEIILQNISIDIDVRLTRGKLENIIYSSFNKLGEINIYNSQLAETLKKLPGAKTIEEYLPTLSRMAGRALSARMALTAGVIGVGGIVGGGIIATILGTAAGAWAGYSGAKALVRAHGEKEFNETMQELNDIHTRGLVIDNLPQEQQNELRKLRRKIMKAEGKGKEPKEEDVNRRDELESAATVEGKSLWDLPENRVRRYAHTLLRGAHRFEKVIGLRSDGTIDKGSVPAILLRRFDSMNMREIQRRLASVGDTLDSMSDELDSEFANYRSSQVRSIFSKLRLDQDLENIAGIGGATLGMVASMAVRFLLMPGLKGQTFAEGVAANSSLRIPTLRGLTGIEGVKEGSIIDSSSKHIEAALNGLVNSVRGIPGVNYLMEKAREIPVVGRLVPGGEVVPPLESTPPVPTGKSVVGQSAPGGAGQPPATEQPPVGQQPAGSGTATAEQPASATRSSSVGKLEKHLGKGFMVSKIDNETVVAVKIGAEGLLEQTENRDQALRVLLSRVYGDGIALKYGGTIPVRAINAIENVVQNIKDPAIVEKIVGEKIDFISVDPGDHSGNTLRFVYDENALNALFKHAMEVATPDAGGTNTSHALWEQRLGHPVEDFKTGEKPSGGAPVREHARASGGGAHEKTIGHKGGGPRVIKPVHEMTEGDEAHEAAQPGLVIDKNIDEAVARGEGKIPGEPGYDGRTSLADQMNALTGLDQDSILNDISNRIERTGINVTTDVGSRLITLQGTLGERGLSGITDIKQAELTLLAKVLEGEASSHVLDTPADGGGGVVVWEKLPSHIKGSVLDVLNKLEKQSMFEVDGNKVSLTYNPMVLNEVWGKSVDLKHAALDSVAEKMSPDAWKKAFSFAPVEQGVSPKIPIAPVDQPPVMRDDIGSPQQRLMEERANEVLRRAGVVPAEVPASGSASAQVVGEAAAQTIVEQPAPVPSSAGVAEGITAQAAEQPVAVPAKVEPVVSDKITAQALDTEQKISGSAVSEEGANAQKITASSEQHVVPKLSAEDVAKQAYQHVLDVLEKQHGINPHLVDYTSGVKVSYFLEKMDEIAAGKATPKDIFGLGAEQYSNKEYQALVKYITDHAPTKAEKDMFLKDYLPSKEK